MSGAFAGRSAGEVFPVVSAVAKLVCEDGKAYAAHVHEALLDSYAAQKESLLSVHQSLRSTRNGIDDRARCERDVHGKPGLQRARFGSLVLPFFFDGTKCFYEVQRILEEELRTLPAVTLTDGDVPYEPLARLHSRRWPMVSEEKLRDWKQCLGFVPDHVVTKTLAATSQLVLTVEAETREMMRDHFQTRLPKLKVRRVNDVCYVDTFFFSVPSIRGYTCFNLYAFKRTGLDVAYLMRRRSQGPTTLPQVVMECGAPTVMKSDNAPEFKGRQWMTYLTSMSIASEFTEAYHSNENLAERHGGALKAATVHLLTVTGCPTNYWCYALEYVCLVRTVLARRSLNWWTPHEAHWGERPDISRFRFTFWQPIWYYQPRQAFPRSKMLKGRFLGIAQNIGDAFCFMILTQPAGDDTSSPQVLARSVIRRRYAREDPPIVVAATSDLPSLVFYKCDGVTPLEDVGTSESGNDEPLSDIVAADDDPERLCRELFQHHDGDDAEETAFEVGIAEVLGPPMKRPRFEATPVPASGASAAATGSPQPQCLTAVEQPECSITTTDTRDISPLAVACVPELDRIPYDLATDLQDPVIDQFAHDAVSSTTGTPSDDPVCDSHLTGPSATGCGSNHITQGDEDVEPDVLNEVNHQFERVAEDTASDEIFDSISGHEWDQGVLLFKLRWKTGETSLVPFSLSKLDYPRETAEYILKEKLGATGACSASGRYIRWARQFNKQYTRVLRRLLHDSSGFVNHESTSTQSFCVASNLPDGRRLVRRVAQQVIARAGGRKRKKPGRISGPVQEKYGVIVPQSVRHALQLDADAGNTFWMDAIKKEIDYLLALDCFSFHSPDYKPSSGYQWTKLSMIFEVKQDGRRKARLVAGGHMVDPMGINSRSTVVKGISVCLLDLIAHRDNLPVLCGDIGNAFITADCMEKIYTHAGPEFGDREGSVLVFKKALYGLRSSSRAFSAHFADFLRSLGFSATRYDRDVWMRRRETEDGYDYICTHVDDFKIVARDPERWQAHITGAFMLKLIGPPSYYLGNDYNFSKEYNAWVVNCATYLKECVRRIESDPDLITDGVLWTQRTPLPEGCHPELDDSELFAEHGIRKYQMLIGMAQWACTIGRLDIAFAVSSLSRFSEAPRAHHLELACHLFGYLKKNPNRRIVVDSRPLMVDDELRRDSFHPDFF